MLAFGCSWPGLFAYARSGSFDVSFLALGWVHVIALGWITLAALSILLHVIPGFLEVEWRYQSTARISTLAFAVGVVVLLAGFFGANVAALQYGGMITFAALLLYAVALVQPLSQAMRGKRVTRAVARAFALTFLLLLVTALLGAFFTAAFAGNGSQSVLADAPRAHALLGIGGWLTLLIVGVSARTMRPITGTGSRWLAVHIASSSAILAGTLLAAVAAAMDLRFLFVLGCVLLLVGMLAYALDVWDILLRATVMHRPPQVLMACATVAAVVAVLLVIGSAFGQAWGEAAVYVALLGWAGSAVLAHMLHIGVRVLLTQARGEDDETRPGAVLVPALSWATIVTYEAAVFVGGIGIADRAPGAVEGAAILGFLAFLTTLLNLASAYRAARQMPIVPEAS